MERERLLLAPRPAMCQVCRLVALGCPSPTLTPICSWSSGSGVLISSCGDFITHVSIYPSGALPPCQTLSWAVGDIWLHQMRSVSSRRIQSHGSGRKLAIRMSCVGPVRGEGWHSFQICHLKDRDIFQSLRGWVPRGLISTPVENI